MTARGSGLGALTLALVFSAAAAAQQVAKPRLDAGRVAGESIGGAYAGVAGYLVGRYAAISVGDLVGVENDVTRRRLGYAGGIVGGGLATAGVIFAVGSMGDQAGDFNATLLGTGVGFVAAVGIAKMFLGPDGRVRTGMSTRARWAAISVVALMPAIGGTIGFNSTRRTQ